MDQKDLEEINGSKLVINCKYFLLMCLGIFLQNKNKVSNLMYFIFNTVVVWLIIVLNINKLL